MNLLYVTIIIFALAAVFGLTMLIKWLKKEEVSRTIVYGHGILAALALALLIVFTLQNVGNDPTVSLVIFIAAALGGFYMFVRELQTKVRPIGVAFAHAVLAVVGFVALLFYVFA